jgi:ProP effector
MSETKEHNPILSPEQREWRKQRDQGIKEQRRLILAEWQEKFPGVFSVEYPKPLAIGTGWKLMNAGIGKRKVDFMLVWYTGRRAYLRAIIAGGPRYGLDGSAGGEVSLQHIEDAKGRLAQRETKEANRCT